MKTTAQSNPPCITGADIGAVARKGVERALAARQAMLELDPELAAAVNGGAAVASVRRTAGMWVGAPTKLAAIPPSPA
jgi:hypothetical protein